MSVLFFWIYWIYLNKRDRTILLNPQFLDLAFGQLLRYRCSGGNSDVIINLPIILLFLQQFCEQLLLPSPRLYFLLTLDFLVLLVLLLFLQQAYQDALEIIEILEKLFMRLRFIII